MAAAAQAFDFADFNAASAPAEPEAAPETPTVKTYTQDELDAACAAAREEALKSMLAGEARNQSAFLENIAKQLNARAGAEIEGVADHVETLTKIAQTIVAEFCMNAAVEQHADAALALLSQYLNANAETAPAQLLLPKKTTRKARAAIKKALTERSAEVKISVDTDADLAPGEIRLEWRGGAAVRNHNDLKAQIAEIFAAVSSERSPA